MNYSQIKEMDITNGDGVGICLFIQGCNARCARCAKSETWDFAKGEVFTEKERDVILASLDKPYVKRLSILGGEPLHRKNIDCITSLLLDVRGKFGSSKQIWIYSGYVFEDLNSYQLMPLSYCDYLVDGPFKEKQKDSTLKYRDCENQRIIDLKRTFQGTGKVVLFEGQGNRQTWAK